MYLNGSMLAVVQSEHLSVSWALILPSPVPLPFTSVAESGPLPSVYLFQPNSPFR